MSTGYNRRRSTQAKVGREKREHPERFCGDRRCLWRTATSPCPRHLNKLAGYEEPTR